MARTERSDTSHIGHGLIRQLIWQLFGKTFPDRMFLRWIDGDALTRFHGNGDLLRAVCQQAFTELVEAPRIMTASREEKQEREGIPRVKSPSKLREPVDDTIIPVTPMPTVT